jgi:hypothetical protein
MFGQAWANKQYFNPQMVGGLVLWLDGSDPSANGVTPANGASVSSWVDKSTSGNNASQGTGANQPVFNTNQINGKGALTFGASKFMSVGSSGFPSGSAARTWFAVVNTSSAATGAYIFLYGTNAVNQYWAPLNIGAPFTVNSALFIDTNNKGAYGNTTIASSTNYIFEMNYAAGNNLSQTAMRINGTAQTLAVTTDAVPNTTLSIGYISSSAAGAGGAPWIGQIAELILYNSSLSATAQGNVRRYLANKWGITA